MAISSLITKSGTNAGATLNKLKPSEGFYGFILILASILLFVGCIKAFRIVSGFAVVQTVFMLIQTILGIGIGALLGFTLFMKAGTTLPEPPPGIPAMPADGSAPPPVPASPGVPTGAANAAAALNMIRVPLGFAGLGITVLNYIFSFF